MVRVGTIVLMLVLAVGCAAGDGSEPSGDDSNETLRVVQISSEAPGEGPRGPRVILSPSAAGLEREAGASVPSYAAQGTYLAAYWGEKPTGGYSMAVESARLEGNTATVRLSLNEPPRDAILTQALTYPRAVAVVRGFNPRGKDLAFVDEEGRELDWPVRLVGG
jgi:PrcB C-terminal